MKESIFAKTLGKSPYKFTQFFALELPTADGKTDGNMHLAPSTENPLGTCAHCKRGIINNYIFENADKKKYSLGPECVFNQAMNKDTFIWVISKDEQEKYEARLHTTLMGATYVVIEDSLENLQKRFESLGMVCLGKYKKDPPSIIEIWV